jgi:glycosyltransferase involved in cell wall biosynthesis
MTLSDESGPARSDGPVRRRILGIFAASRQRDDAGEEQRPVIALVSDAIFPYHRGGKEIRYQEVSRRLARRAEVHVYTMHWWDGPRVRRDEAITLHAISRLFPMYVQSRRSLKQALFFALACIRLLAARFDVLEADHMPYLQILVLRFVATVRRKRFVVTWHEVWGKSYWRQYLGWAGLAAWFVERLAMRLPDHIIAASSHTAERLCTVLGARASVTVAPNGIDLDAIRSSYPNQSATDLVVVSRLISHKRIDMLLDAVALLHAEGMPVTCRVIGDGPQREELQNRAHAVGLDSAVEFRHDIREQKELYALVKAAKVFVFPSAREGFGIAVLEALACGTPVVTTSAPDNLAQHLVAQSPRGTICDPSAAAMAAAVKALLAGGLHITEKIGGENDDWLAAYGWDVMTEQVANALQI